MEKIKIFTIMERISYINIEKSIYSTLKTNNNYYQIGKGEMPLEIYFKKLNVVCFRSIIVWQTKGCVKFYISRFMPNYRHINTYSTA
jgi:hypothetical protein